MIERDPGLFRSGFTRKDQKERVLKTVAENLGLSLEKIEINETLAKQILENQDEQNRLIHRDFDKSRYFS